MARTTTIAWVIPVLLLDGLAVAQPAGQPTSPPPASSRLAPDAVAPVDAAPVRDTTPSPPAGLPPLRLADAIRLASARTPEAAATVAAVAAARARVPVEQELMPPMVDAQAWQWPLDTWNPANVQWMVGIEQEFPGRGKRQVKQARMEAEANLMANDLRATRRAAAVDVVRAYIDLRVAREELDTIASARTLVRQSVDASEARYAAGRSSQQDTLAGIVELSRLSQDEVMSRERERMARSTLNVLLGRAPDEPVGALDPAADERSTPTLADVEPRLRETHPEMTAIDRARDVAAADLAVARQSSRPDYVVGAGYMTMPSMRDAVQFKVGLTWPNAPWVKQRVNKEVAVAEADAAAAEARRDAVAQRLRMMAQELIVKADAAAERAAVIQSTVLPPAEHVIEVARVAYLADRAEFMPVIDAQRVILDARLEIRRAIADRDRALAELSVLLGEFDPPSPSEPALDGLRRAAPGLAPGTRAQSEIADGSRSDRGGRHAAKWDSGPTAASR